MLLNWIKTSVQVKLFHCRRRRVYQNNKSRFDCEGEVAMKRRRLFQFVTFMREIIFHSRQQPFQVVGILFHGFLHDMTCIRPEKLPSQTLMKTLTRSENLISWWYISMKREFDKLLKVERKKCEWNDSWRDLWFHLLEIRKIANRFESIR